MISEPSLFDGLPSERMVRTFAHHRRAHPEVYQQLRALAREMRAAGWRRIGIALLFEQIRWRRGPKAKDDEGWAMNNTMRALYARALDEENDDLRGMFEFRRLRAV